MQIIRAERLDADEVVWVVRISEKEIHHDLDAHALATTLDQLRVKMKKEER